ncbi:MAG: glycosyltransferase [Candidatus Bilamarchaeaceae archaeon]
MKIAIVSDTFRPQKNGVVVFLEDFLPRLAKKTDVVVIVPGQKNYLVKSRDGNITYYFLPSLPFPFYPGYRMAISSRTEIKKILEEEKPDVVHLHAPVLIGLKALYISKSINIPTVITYHTHFPDYVSHLSKGLLKGDFENIAKLPVKKLIKTVFSKANVVTAPTPALREELRSYGLPNVEFIPNGIDFSKFKNSKKVNVRAKHNIPKKNKIVLYVGRISFEKKIDILLSAFKKVRATRENTTLLIVGTGPYLNDYVKLAKAMNLQDVIFAGFVPDAYLPSYYKIADVFASASDTETFGLTFIEAMFFGLPVVGVNKLGASDVIKKETGLLAEAGNAGDFGRCLSILLDHDNFAKELGKNGKNEARKYSIEKVTWDFMNIYKRLC